MSSKNLSVTAETGPESAPAVSPVSRRSSTRRLLFLSLLFAAALAAYWFVVGQPRWRAARYAHAGIDELVPLCSPGRDIQACSVLVRKAIAAQRTEKALPPLQANWSQASAGKLALSPSEKADLAGSLALAQMLGGHVEEAPPLFTLAIQLDFNRPAAHLAYAFWLTAQGQDPKALRELDFVTLAEPENDLAYFLKAHVLIQNNMLDKGREAAQKAIALNPKIPSYWQELGDSYGYADKQEESLKAYQEELKLDPQSKGALADVARATALVATTPEQYTAAVKKIEAVLSNEPINPGAGWTLLGEMHLKFGHYPEAAKALELAIKEDDTIPETYYKLARAKRLSGDEAGAEQDMRKYKVMYGHYQNTRMLQKKIGENPNEADLHLALAKEWEYYQAWRRAGQEYEKVLQSRPGDPIATKRIMELKRMIQEGRAVTPHNWVLERLLRASTTLNQPPPPGVAAPGAPPLTSPDAAGK